MRCRESGEFPLDKTTRNAEIVLKILRQGKTLKTVAPEYGLSSSFVRRILLDECCVNDPVTFKNGERHQMIQHRPLPPTLNYLRRHREDFLKPIEASGYTIEWMEHSKKK